MNVQTNDDQKCAHALAPLYYVNDPEIGLNVVDLGLIYRIDFVEEEKKVVVAMTLTSQFCPMGESIVENVTRALESVFKEYEIEVNLTFDPPWNPQFISEEGQQFLNG